MAKRITALMILDGFGTSAQAEGNAIRAAGTPHIDALKREFPHTLIGASGMAVGLPEGQMGNSEVGHLNIGAGRVVYQELTRITKSIQDGDFFENAVLTGAVDSAVRANKALHLMGLISDGGVHSHLDHLYALVELAKRRGLTRVYIHCFMDGRDVPPQSGAGYIAALQKRLGELAAGEIATIIGRYYAMDRDNRWERVEQAYRALVHGEGVPAEDAVRAMQASYAAGVTDEFVHPVVLQKKGKPVATIQDGDSVVFFNFRPDRARELTRALTQPGFDGFARQPLALHYVCMTQYDKTFTGVQVAFAPQTLQNTLGEYLSKLGKKQFRIAETEKYAHVTFFFNGGVEQPNPGEDRFLIPSPKVATYDLQPEMSAREVAATAVEKIRTGEYDAMILNFANPDMVGHTGIMEAAEKAVRTVDECVGEVFAAIREMGGQAIITADHGNAERMIDDDGGAFTAHTTNPVLFILASESCKNAQLRQDGVLADIAPTLLELMGLEQPAEMTGKSMIVAK